MERKCFANIEFRVVDGESCRVEQDLDLKNICSFLPSEAVTLFYEYPLKVIIPSSASGGCCQWVYPITFGGGLVEGDYMDIIIRISRKCCVLSTTMSSPKVYICNKGRDSQQHTKYFIDSEALMCVLPDPLVCYEKASYIQSQTFHLEPDGNLVLLDWFTSGRYSCGERWVFTRLKSMSSIFINGKLQFRECQNMQDTPFVSLKAANKSYDIIGTCIVIGPYLKFLYSEILSKLGKCRAYGEKPDKESLFAVSSLHSNGESRICGCIVRFAAVSVPETIRRLEDLLQPLFAIIGDNPFAKK